MTVAHDDKAAKRDRFHNEDRVYHAAWPERLGTVWGCTPSPVGDYYGVKWDDGSESQEFQGELRAAPLPPVQPGTFKTWEKDGFVLTASREADDANPGEDDVSPRLVAVDPASAHLPGVYPGIMQGEYWSVADGEIERLAKAWDEPAEKVAPLIEEEARAWANRTRSYCGVIVTASRAGIELSRGSLWRIDCDESTPEATGEAARYLREVAAEVGDEAVEAARAKLAELAG